MEKLDTIRKRNNPNEVYSVGDIGANGTYHDYRVSLMRGKETLGFEAIHFQNGAQEDIGARHGVFDSDLLEIVRDRLTWLQWSEFAAIENAHALTHIEEALRWLDKRDERTISGGAE